MKKSLLVIVALMFSTSVFAAVDCTNKKNVNKIQCKKPPTSSIEDKAKVKPPVKVRKAPDSVKKKAEANK